MPNTACLKPSSVATLDLSTENSLFFLISLSLSRPLILLHCLSAALWREGGMQTSQFQTPHKPPLLKITICLLFQLNLFLYSNKKDISVWPCGCHSLCCNFLWMYAWPMTCTLTPFNTHWENRSAFLHTILLSLTLLIPRRKPQGRSLISSHPQILPLLLL